MFRHRLGCQFLEFPWQQFIDPGIGMADDDALEHVGQIGVRFNIVEFGSFDQRGNNALVAAAFVMFGEKRVFSA
jgi:hypothetical protein